ELYDMDGNVDLYLQRTVPPTLAQFEFNSTQGGTDPEQIVVRTNAALPDLNGEWYLAVPNLEATDVNFTIRAVVANATGILISGQPLDIRVRPATPPVTGFELTWSTVDGERYRIDVSDDLATWTTLGFVDAMGTTATFSDPTPAQPLRFYRIVQVPVP
ncbi:MAG TPA: hypothetical protein VMS21_11140, partial [Methylomirabilota bacterium]|nr:hypothetical protein [Methylomirabilota bacterium]